MRNVQLTLDITNLDTYVRSLKAIVYQIANANNNLSGPYFDKNTGYAWRTYATHFLGQKEDLILCKHSRAFEEIFGQRTIHVTDGENIILVVTLQQNSLYVTKIAGHGGIVYWEEAITRNRAQEVRYTTTVTDSSNNSKDQLSTNDQGDTDLAFWNSVKNAAADQNFLNFFAAERLVNDQDPSSHNRERIFVYVAEAIRFPSFFVNQFSIMQQSDFFPISTFYRDYAHNWKDLSKAILAKAILRLWNNSSENSRRPLNATSIVQNSGLVAEDKEYVKLIADEFEVLLRKELSS